MNHYTMRLMIAKDLQGFLAKSPNASYVEFCQQMVKTYGVTSRTVDSILKDAYGLVVKDGEMVKA